jgi:hypothetical protein
MVEVMGTRPSRRTGQALAEGAEVDWAEAFAGYGSQVDFPGAAVWHELSVAFPDAKVIHTERPEDAWWASYSSTIGKFFALRESIPLPPPIAADGRDDGHALRPATDGRLRQGRRDRRLPAEQREGPLDDPAGASAGLHALRRLGAALRLPRRRGPATPFPRTHARDEFWAHFGGEPAAA